MIALVTIIVVALLAAWVFWTLSKLTVRMDGVLERLDRLEAALASRPGGGPPAA